MPSQRRDLTVTGNLRYGFGIGGGLIKNKSSFNRNVFTGTSYETPNLNAALPDGTVSQSLPIRTQHDNLFVNGQMDYALTLDQTLRFGYNLTRFTNDNLGVGGYDLAGRAYSNANTQHNIRVQHYGPIGRRAFSRSRVQVFLGDPDTQSAINAPTVRVNDAFTSGGGIFNDRPAGVGRNTLRTDGQVNVNGLLGYQFAFGHTAALPPGIGVFGGGNAAQVRTFDQGTARYRMTFFVQGFNLANRANFIGYSGTIPSRFFLPPTAARDMRKVEVGLTMTF